MQLVFITNNGFSEKKGDYYYNSSNIQHYSTVTKHFDDIIFVAKNNSHEGYKNKVEEKYEVRFVRSLTQNLFVFPYNLLKLNQTLKGVIKSSDIVMCFGINGYFAYRIAKKFNKPIITYIGGCEYDILSSMDSRLKRMSAPLIMFMIKQMVYNSDFVHYVDDYLLERYPTKGENLICSSVNINVSEYSLRKRLKKIDKFNKNGVKKIGLIGYVHNKIKGMDTAIKALKLLDDKCVLEVVGRGDNQWLINLAKKIGVIEQVKFLGVIKDRTKLFDWLDSIDIYIQPSITEGLPRATIEAMSRGCPIVSSHAGGLKNLIDKNFRVEAGDHINLAKKIKLIIGDLNKMRSLAKTNHELSKDFDAEILNKKRDKFYENIIKETKNKY